MALHFQLRKEGNEQALERVQTEQEVEEDIAQFDQWFQVKVHQGAPLVASEKAIIKTLYYYLLFEVEKRG